MKRTLIVLTLVVFACSSAFLFSACAKKQVVAEEEEIVAPIEPVEEAIPEEELPTEEFVEVVPEEAARPVEEEVELTQIREAEAEERALQERRAARFEGESIYFDFDKSFIKPEYRPVLEEKAEYLRDYGNTRIRIEGNCDERGTNEYNLALGERRANSAKNFLVSLGISPDRIETISYGEERPLFLEHNEAAWSQNRRDDFVVMER
jgi:peptidoglycan-associated lipoprotein